MSTFTRIRDAVTGFLKSNLEIAIKEKAQEKIVSELIKLGLDKFSAETVARKLIKGKSDNVNPT